MGNEIKFPAPVARAGPDKMCASCAAWQPPPAEMPAGTGQVVMGQCRRHPPTPFIMQVQVGKIVGPGGGSGRNVQPTIISAWPPSPASGGCMDWMPEEKPDAVP